MNVPKAVGRSVAVLVVLVVLGGIGLRFFRAVKGTSTPIDKVLLISIDTCRADVLGCYGCPLPTTPNIDAVAGEGILFENVISPVPLTLPAHCSMLTGTIPPYHGVHDNMEYRLSDSHVTLAELLTAKGFAAGAVVSAFVLDSRFGLNQGFETYHDRFDEKFEAHGIAQRRAAEVNRHTLQWLDEHAEEPFFLFVHYYDPHAPYEPPAPFAQQFADNAYAGEVAYVDHCIGEVLGKLRQLDIYDSTLVIITGDHGEMLGEHGEADHGFFVYQGAIRVPLIFKLPGRNGPARISGPAGLVDIVPTVCRLAGVPAPSGLRGRDLSPYFRNPRISAPERYLYVESFFPTRYGANSLLGLVTKDWKYIETTRPELYDLGADPNEAVNLSDKEPDVTRMMQERLKGILKARARWAGPDGTLTMDEASRRRLESLGYVGGAGVIVDFTIDRSQDDPKDLIEFHLGCQGLLALVDDKEYEEARILAEKLIKERPGAFGPRFDLATIAMREKDFSKAVSLFQQALEIDPDHALARAHLGHAYYRAGKPAEAIIHCREALRLNPDSVDACNTLGIALHEAALAEPLTQRHAKISEAIDVFRKVVRLAPTFPEGHYNLGIAVARQGMFEEAIRHYRQALILNAGYVDAHNDLGNALCAQGTPQEAVPHYREALRLDPGFADAHNNLGNVLLATGTPEEARRHYREALRLKPDFADAHNNLGNVLRALGRIEEAITHCREALRLRPDFAEAHYNLALALGSQGKLEEAVTHLEEAVRLRPDSTEARETLARIKRQADSAEDP